MTQRKNARESKTFLRQRAFIAAYAATASMTAAAKAAHVSRQQHYHWLEQDAYRKAWEDTQEQAAQTAEDEAVRRAIAGVKRPVLYKGLPVKTGRRILYEYQYSDTLLLALLKRFRPALYREHVTAEVTGTVEIVERMQAARKRLVEMQKHDIAGNG
jgi:argininosuccinate synthase